MARLPRSPIQRQSILNRSMLPGGVNGRSALVAPEPRPLVPPLIAEATIIRVPFAYSGTVAVGRSTPYPVDFDGWVESITVTARAAASGSSTFRLRKNGTLVGSTGTLSSGSTYVTWDAGGIHVTVADILDLEILTVGSGLADLGGHIALKG